MHTNLKPPDSYHHGDLRAALIRLAIDETERHGFESIKLSVLGRMLGVSQAAPYRHFADRESLLEAVATEGCRVLNAALTAALPDDVPRSPALRLARACLAFARANRGMYRLMFASRVYARASADSELYRLGRENLILLADAFGARAGRDERERTALKVWAALHGIIMLDEMGFLSGKPSSVDINALVDDIVDQNERHLAALSRDDGAGGAEGDDG
jgi:AcrR family transcriptional regulator